MQTQAALPQPDFVLPNFVDKSTAAVLSFVKRSPRGYVNDLACDQQAASKDFPRQTELTASELWLATKEERIVPHYQPVFELETGRMVGAEALVRIVDEDGALIRPDRFIAEAEHSGVIVPLGRMVIRHACETLASMRSCGMDLPRVSINLSGLQLELDASLAPFVGRTLAKHGLAADQLEFELASSNLPKLGGIARDTVVELRELGVRRVLDDFGIDNDAIACLQTFDVDALKLAPSIVARLPQDLKAGCLVRRLVCLAQALGAEVIGTCLETQAQLDSLADTGCRYGQGYVHSRPSPAAELLSFMQPH